MGFLSNLMKKLFGSNEEVKAGTPITATITTRKKKTDCASITARNICGYQYLSVPEKMTIAQTIETLSDKPEDVAMVCGLQPRQAKYVVRACLTDKKWASTVTLSQFVGHNDVLMMYWLYKQCSSIGAVAAFFGISSKTVSDYFNKMEPADKRKAEKYITLPKNSTGVRLSTYVRELSNEELDNLLWLFRKAKKVTALRYVIPMYRDCVNATIAAKLFTLWKYAAEEEARRANEQNK